MYRIILSVLLLLAAYAGFGQQQVSAKKEVKKVTKGQLMKTQAEVYYNLSKNEIVVDNQYPTKFVMKTNNKGEAKIYFPERNEVMVEQQAVYAAESDLLFFFLSGKATDMGLAEQGYQLVETRYDQELMITEWTPPLVMSEQIKSVELVLNNYLPVYYEFIGADEQVINKAYFSNYQPVEAYMVPLRITEIEYLPQQDSLVSRIDYTDLKIGAMVDENFINYQIPTDAKPIKLKPEDE